MTLSSRNGPCEWGQQMLWYRTCGQLMSCINGPTAPGRPEGPGRAGWQSLCCAWGGAHMPGLTWPGSPRGGLTWRDTLTGRGEDDRAEMGRGGDDVIPWRTHLEFVLVYVIVRNFAWHIIMCHMHLNLARSKFWDLFMIYSWTSHNFVKIIILETCLMIK